MTTRINIHIEADSAAEARSQMIGLLGDSYKVDSGWREVEVNAAYDEATRNAIIYGSGAVMADPLNETYAAVGPKELVPTEAPKRERGKPAPGKARRTKEEIAEDEAADAADAAQAAPAEVQPNISTGEERIDPTTAEDAAQDAADEAAEAEVVKPKELTHDDVRAALQKLSLIHI